MNQISFQVFKDLEMDLKFLNHQLQNKFNVQKIENKEDLEVLFEKPKENNFDLKKEITAHDLLTQTDQMLNEIYESIIVSKENIHTLSASTPDDNIGSNINLEQFFEMLFDYFQTKQTGKEIMIQIDNFQKFQQEKREILKEFYIMICDYYYKFKKEKVVDFQLDQKHTQIVQQKIPASKIDQNFSHFQIDQKNVDFVFDVLLSLEEEEVLFKVNQIWIRILDLDRKQKDNLKGSNFVKRLIFKIIN